MAVNEDIERRRRAYLALVDYAQVMGSRDTLVREARAAGIRATDIAEIMRLSARQVRRIAGAS